MPASYLGRWLFLRLICQLYFQVLCSEGRALRCQVMRLSTCTDWELAHATVFLPTHTAWFDA